MARQTRVLVVDDSALVRHRLQKIIGEAHGFEIAGAASSGQECLDMLQTAQPDVVTLDMWMPGMDGLATLRRLMQERPTPVIMVSSQTEAGAQVTLDALALGAVDYLTKPSVIPRESNSPFNVELVHKLGIAAQVRLSHLSRSAAAARESSGGERPTRRLGGLPAIVSRGGRPLVVVGSSTGGPQALDRLFSDLPVDLPALMLVVQHMPPVFTTSLAARLARRSGLDVREAREGDQLVVGAVRVAPGGSHLTLGADQRLHLDQSPPIHGVRPAVNRTLASVADHWSGRCLAVILTGMGVDGTDGARAVRAKGAEVYAQDESTSIVYGMPRSVIDAGLAAAALPLEQMAPAICRWIGIQAAIAV